MKPLNRLSTLSLLYIALDHVAFAFQSLPRNKLHHATRTADYLSELALGFQSIAAPAKVPDKSSRQELIRNKNGNTRRRTNPRLSKTIPSGQKQLPGHVRVAKAMYEECQIWFLSLALPVFASLVAHSYLPLQLYLGFEFIFCVYCTHKLLSKLNVPATPEPLVHTRKWEDVATNVWASQTDTASRRDFIMGWFYDVPFERLRMEDALSYMAWMRYGLPLESGVLTNEEIESLCEFDLPLLLENVNNGKSLPKRNAQEEALPIMRFNCEPLRYRHKPMLFYGATHGIKMALQIALEKMGFVYVKAEDPEKDLSYWSRLPTTRSDTKSNDIKAQDGASKESNSLVFIHGVGGLGFCYKLIEDLKMATRGDTPIILIDLPHVSLQMYNEIPKIQSQVESIFSIIDDITDDTTGDNSPPSKATLVGHSYGTAIMSWMVQSKPERISGCVFLDPICFQLHLKTTLFNFHFQRADEKLQLNKEWGNPFSLGKLINLAGTEMHTNYAMLRQFSWATNALWPDDLMQHGVRTSVILSGKDEIVPVKDVEELFQTSAKSGFLETHTFDEASHGDLFFDGDMRAETVDKIMDVMNTAQSTKDTELWDFSSGLKSLFTTSP